VVWELNPVRQGDGGTRFLTGSHKARIEYPPSVLEMDNAEMGSYDCPAGSVIIFTESLLHASTAWKNPDVDRVAVFNCYNSLWAQWHRLHQPEEVFADMPPRRRSLFRGVWAADFTQRPVQRNMQYAEDNRAL
jgi:ectoine hydroxylase-related dioxygenase (phytanoyl-CoA dioxygenase family)